MKEHAAASSFALPWSGDTHYALPTFGGVGLPEGTLYLDNAAATPLCLPAFDAMAPWLLGMCGNPANRLHPMGELAEHALAAARATVARALGVEQVGVTFTASATEANNLVLRGLVDNPMRKRGRLVVGATEHSSVLATALRLAELHQDVEVVVLPVDAQGQVDLEAARTAIDGSTLCVALMDVNNETGVVQAGLPAVAAMARAAGAALHVDAVQGFARGELGADPESVPFDTAVVSGAKMNGPKGAAALITRRRKPRLRFEPQLTGGGQEGNLRSGTPNVPAIIGFARAVEWYALERQEGLTRIGRLEERFLSTLRAELKGRVVVAVHGEGARRVPGIASVHFEGVNAMKLVEEARVVCASVGSACRTLQATASHVLLAMGVSEEASLASLRVSFGLCNTDDEAVTAAKLLAHAALKVKSYSAVL